MRNYHIYRKLNTFQNSNKALFVTQYQPKTKEDIVARVHKYNVNTITMVKILIKNFRVFLISTVDL
jgi:hypothetical protein